MLTDISSAIDGCEVFYDHDVVAKNQAEKHLIELSAENIDGDQRRQPGRIL